MGNIRKIGDQYYIEFYARGLMYSQIAGATEEQAKELLVQIESTIASGESLTTVRDIDFTAFAIVFCQYISNQESIKTAQRFQSLVHHFQRFLQENYPHLTKLSHITPTVVDSYKVYLAKRVPPKLVNFSLLLLREMMEYGINTGFINDNPTWHVRLLPWARGIIKDTVRTQQLKDLLAKGVTFTKAYRLMKLTDIGKMLYFANLIPLTREDMYN